MGEEAIAGQDRRVKIEVGEETAVLVFRELQAEAPAHEELMGAVKRIGARA